MVNYAGPTQEDFQKEWDRRRSLRNVVIKDENHEKVVAVPEYGEIKIVCHDGKVKTIETTVKEQF